MFFLMFIIDILFAMYFRHLLNFHSWCQSDIITRFELKVFITSFLDSISVKPKGQQPKDSVLWVKIKMFMMSFTDGFIPLSFSSYI